MGFWPHTDPIHGFARLVGNLTETLRFVVFLEMKNIRSNFNKEFGLVFNCRFLISDCL